LVRVSDCEFENTGSIPVIRRYKLFYVLISFLRTFLLLLKKPITQKQITIDC
jgi:hypothetical protein